MRNLFSLGALCAMIGLGAAGGCGQDPASEKVSARGGEPVLSFAEYLDRFVVEKPDHHGYIVEYDLHMTDLDMVRRYWAATTGTGGALSVHRVASADDIWNASDRWNIAYCVRPGDFGADYNRVVQMLDKAAAGWENAADVRFVHVASLDTDADCTRSNNSVKYNVEHNSSAGFVAGMGFPSFARAGRYLEMGDTWTWTDAFLLAVLTHELGHSLGMVHEHDTTPGCNYATSDPNGYRQLTCYDGRSAMHYPFKPGWLDPGRKLNFIAQWDVEGAQSVYGAPTNVINLANGTVFARKHATGDIYKYSAGSWVKIGNPGQAFVAVGNTLYGQTPGRGSPVRWTGRGWVYIGGPAGQIFGCLGTLCATVPDNGNIVKYDAGTNSWTVIGGPGSRFAASAAQLFGIGPWQDDYVARWAAPAGPWYVVGDGASELFGGGNTMYRLTGDKNSIQRYDGDWSWTTIGGAGRQFTPAGDSLYGLTPDRGTIWRYAGGGWSPIGGAAARMYGTAGYFFATSPDGGTIWQYDAGSNTWTCLGGP